MGGRKTQVTFGGEGPGVLYLHSAGGEAEWTSFHNDLAQSMKLCVPAHPGFSLSTGLEQIRDIQDLAWHTIDLLDELGIEQTPVIGFSLGAWLAMEIAVLRPERFSKMLLVNAAGIRVAESPMGELFIDDLDQLRRLLFHNAEGDHVEEAMPTSLNDSRILMWLRAREATARVGWNPYLHDPKLPDHLHRVSCPALVLWGRRDQLIPLPHGERLAELLPNAELRILDDCGHMLPYEKRVEFVEICRDFLSR